MARIFLAIPLTEEIKNKVLELHIANEQVGKIVWMKPENLHMTIYFIGQVSRENTPAIINRIKNVLKGQTSLSVLFEKYSIAPNERPRMIWARFHRSPAFTSLSNKIHTEIKELIPSNAFYYEDPIPHITLARFNSTFNTELISFPKIDLREIEIKDCELWESVPTPRGVNYECVERFSFKD